MSMEPTLGNTAKQSTKATFGRLSLFVFGGSVAIALFFLLTASSSGYGGANGFAYGVFGLIVGCFACALNIVIAIIGLVRRECPRWPAVTGLVLSLPPALGAIYIS